MRWSNAFIPTLRDDPADAEATSHKLLVRAGFVRQLMSGVYSLLPLGQRVCHKITAIVREEMNAIGGQECHLPALHPGEIWRRSGRWSTTRAGMWRRSLPRPWRRSTSGMQSDAPSGTRDPEWRRRTLRFRSVDRCHKGPPAIDGFRLRLLSSARAQSERETRV